MTDVRELPEHIRDFVEMSKEYLRQETLEPAKQLGRFVGLAVTAGIAFAIGTVMVAIAGMRYLQKALPEGPNWEALGYVVAALGLGIVAGIIASVTGRRTSGRG